MTNSVLLRMAGLLAVVGGVLNGFADYLLQGGLVARAAVNTYENLATVPYEMVFWGSIIGNAAIPLWLLGFWPVYVALAPAGRWLALPPVLFLGYGFSLFAGYHGSYALYAAGFQAQTDAPAELADTTSVLVQRLHDYHDALMVLIGICMPIGSLWFVAVVLFFRTHFQKWMVIASPLIVPLTQPLIEMLPGPWGGYIRPAWGTTLFSLFFLMATIVTWHVNPATTEKKSA